MAAASQRAKKNISYIQTTLSYHHSFLPPQLSITLRMQCQTLAKTQMRLSSSPAQVRFFVVQLAPKSVRPDRREKVPIDSMPRDGGRAPRNVTPLPPCPIHVPRAISQPATTAMSRLLAVCGFSATRVSTMLPVSCAQSHTVPRRLSLMHIRMTRPVKTRLRYSRLHQSCNRSQDVRYRRHRRCHQWRRMSLFRPSHPSSLQPHCPHLNTLHLSMPLRLSHLQLLNHPPVHPLRSNPI